jgi:glycosyltransferase involved in cell wall biosynthesis
MGARRSYAVPHILAKASSLERFYTDACGNVGSTKSFVAAVSLIGLSEKFTNLSRRRVPERIKSNTKTFNLPTMIYALRRSICNDNETKIREHFRFSQRIGFSMIRAGYGSATHIYSMLGEGGPFLAEGRRRGLKVISEVYIAPSTERIVDAERARYPDWEPDAPDITHIRSDIVIRDPFLESDWFICPSQFVQDDLVLHWGIDRNKTIIVPYGVSPAWLDLVPYPEKGRVLFVGTAELRKGIHYLALAANILVNRGRKYEFRVAGDVSDTVRSHPLSQKLRFLGRVSRAKIHQEFQQADVFVLPSLAEGSAEATYEALASSVPVITTKAAGSVLRSGQDGLIVAERDPNGLADALEQIIEDRQSRGEMAFSAREIAASFTWEHYGYRLVEALERAA